MITYKYLYTGNYKKMVYKKEANFFDITKTPKVFCLTFRVHVTKDVFFLIILTYYLIIQGRGSVSS